MNREVKCNHSTHPYTRQRPDETDETRRRDGTTGDDDQVKHDKEIDRSITQDIQTDTENETGGDINIVCVDIDGTRNQQTNQEENKGRKNEL